MKSEQLTLNQKVKLRLIQPKIKCAGRDDVTCHYRGKVIRINESLHEALITFKMYGVEVIGSYDLQAKQFRNPEFKEIRIV